MTSKLKKAFVASAVAAMIAVPVAATTAILTADAAFAKSGKEKKEKKAKKERPGNSRSNASEKKPHPVNHGAVASELKNLNAANAFKNGNVPNANPNSNVGQIGTYQVAVNDTVLAWETWDTTEMAYADHLLNQPVFSVEEYQAQIDQAVADYLLANPDASQEDIDAHVADLVLARDTAAGWEEQKTFLEGQRVLAFTEYENKVRVEEEALLMASGGRTLSEEAVSYLRSLLGF